MKLTSIFYFFDAKLNDEWSNGVTSFNECGQVDSKDSSDVRKIRTTIVGYFF